jgi:hypothetical protein
MSGSATLESRLASERLLGGNAVDSEGVAPDLRVVPGGVS